MSDESSRRREYERALRWYPLEWRRAHGAALVGDLMEQDDVRGRRHLTVADRASLFAQGLRTRSLQRAVPSGAAVMLRIVALLGCAFFAVFYWTTSPVELAGALPAGTSLLASHEPKTLLNNGTVVPALLLALGLAASFARRDVLARALAGLAALAALIVMQLAVGTWNGPDAPVGTALVIFGVMSALPIRRWTAVGGFIALVAAVLLLELWLAWTTPALAIAASACLLAAAGIGVLQLRRWLHYRDRDSSIAGPAA